MTIKSKILTALSVILGGLAVWQWIDGYMRLDTDRASFLPLLYTFWLAGAAFLCLVKAVWITHPPIERKRRVTFETVKVPAEQPIIVTADTSGVKIIIPDIPKEEEKTNRPFNNGVV